MFLSNKKYACYMRKKPIRSAEFVTQCMIFFILTLFLFFRQHNETVRRGDHTLKELEYYRGQHQAAMAQLEAAAQESSSLRSKYSDLISDKQRVDRELLELRSGCCTQPVSAMNIDNITSREVSNPGYPEIYKLRFHSMH